MHRLMAMCREKVSNVHDVFGQMINYYFLINIILLIWLICVIRGI